MADPRMELLAQAMMRNRQMGGGGGAPAGPGGLPPGAPVDPFAALAYSQAGQTVPQAGQDQYNAGGSYGPTVPQMRRYDQQDMMRPESESQEEPNDTEPDADPDDAILAQVQNKIGMNDPYASKQPQESYPDPARDGPENWPPTVEQFIAKYGREPATDSEVEYYADDSYGDEADRQTNGSHDD